MNFIMNFLQNRLPSFSLKESDSTDSESFTISAEDNEAVKKLWRQGDILIQECEQLPEKIKRKKGTTLVHSQTSGNAHRIAEKRTCRIFESTDDREKKVGTLYIEVFADKAEIIHQEHNSVTLEKGLYCMWRQREFELSGSFRIVMD